MEIVTIKDIRRGDVIIIHGLKENQIIIVEVERKTQEGLIIPKDMGGLDYTPEDPDEIIRLSTGKEKANVVLKAKSIIVTISEYWQQLFLNTLTKK